MKQEPGRQQPGISVLTSAALSTSQGGEDVNCAVSRQNDAVRYSLHPTGYQLLEEGGK